MSRAWCLAAGTCLAALAVWAHREPKRSPELDRLAAAGRVVRELLDRFGHRFSPADRETLRESSQHLIVVGLDRDTTTAARDEVAAAIGRMALARVERVLDGCGHVERLWAGERPFAVRLHRSWPSGRGALMLRIGQPGPASDDVPEFLRVTLDLAVSPRPVLQVGTARTVYAIVFFENAAQNPASLRLTAGNRLVGTVSLSVAVPPPGVLLVDVNDEAGKPTGAVAGVYASDRQLLIPPQAISFEHAGNSYERGRSRAYRQPRYWPGGPQQRQVFFINGGFALQAPEGEYTVIVGKGMEYSPVLRRVSVQAGQSTRLRIALGRWIDMPARGWISGDGHVHYERRDRAANGNLLTWIKAEDVHVASVMQMGDVRGTYFPQYAFGAEGSVTAGAYSLVAGQEDPRTPDIGHVLAMNISAPVHRPERYYLYDVALDELRRQGGLTGYAHGQQAPRVSFWVRRDMSLNVPRGKVDFLEVSEFGDIEDRLYHEFLNLGFKLTATAGSDVPWGDSVGTSRVYAYTGGSTRPEDWFGAVKQGRTFVTTGPMLSLRVNGELPGTEIKARAGDTLFVEVEAEGALVAPRYLEVVTQGEVAGSAAEQTPRQSKIRLRMRLPVRRSAWVIARCSGAMTSPVYVSVGGRPFWNRAVVPELVDLRLEQLGEMEAFAKRVLEPGFSGEYNDPVMLRLQVPALLERIGAARRTYIDLRERARAEQ